MNDFSSQKYIYVVEVCTSHVLSVCVCVFALGHEVFYVERCNLVYDCGILEYLLKTRRIFLFFAMPSGSRDLSSPTRGGTWTPAVEAQS